jgi:hypothetical protein
MKPTPSLKDMNKEIILHKRTKRRIIRDKRRKTAQRRKEGKHALETMLEFLLRKRKIHFSLAKNPSNKKTEEDLIQISGKISSLYNRLVDQIGLRPLVELTAEYAHLAAQRISGYQEIIRNENHQWQNVTDEKNRLDHAGFKEKFCHVYLGYVATAGALLAKIKMDSCPKAFLNDAIKSESWRGSVGKSDPDGLDARRDQAVERFEAILVKNGISDDEIESVVQALPIFPEGIFPFETELELLFNRYLKTCGQPLSIENVEILERQTNGLVGRILAEFLSFNLGAFNKSLAAYLDRPPRSIEEIEKETRISRRVSLEVLSETRTRLSPSDLIEFDRLAEEISDLTILDLSPEAKFGFKSWPGLPHFLVFKHAIEGQEPSFLAEAINQNNEQNTYETNT